MAMREDFPEIPSPIPEIIEQELREVDVQLAGLFWHAADNRPALAAIAEALEQRAGYFRELL